MKKTGTNTKENRILTITMAALLLGFAWQIRGSGTSDPSVVAVLFLLFLSFHYSPRKKFNLFIFGLVALSFNLLRTGRWEYRASNANLGWGVWSTETGWTQGWITTMLMLRELDTNFWDFTSKSHVADTFEKYRKLMLTEIEQE